MFCKGVIQTILIYTLELLKVIPMQKKTTKKKQCDLKQILIF